MRAILAPIRYKGLRLMPVSRATWSAALWCAMLIVGCRGTPEECPQALVTADPAEIPQGQNRTDLFVEVTNPFPDNGLVVVTELSTDGGAIADPFSRATTFACAHDVSGPVEVCVTTTYLDESATDQALSEVPNVVATREYIRPAHIRLPDPIECSTTQCSLVVVCPEEKNVCPAVASLVADPTVLADGETAAVTVVANDPDSNPEELVTTITARKGTIADPHAEATTYTCDPAVGGVIEICVVASDGD